MPLSREQLNELITIYKKRNPFSKFFDIPVISEIESLLHKQPTDWQGDLSPERQGQLASIFLSHSPSKSHASFSVWQEMIQHIFKIPFSDTHEMHLHLVSLHKAKILPDHLTTLINNKNPKKLAQALYLLHQEKMLTPENLAHIVKADLTKYTIIVKSGFFGTPNDTENPAVQQPRDDNTPRA